MTGEMRIKDEQIANLERRNKHLEGVLKLNGIDKRELTVVDRIELIVGNEINNAHILTTDQEKRFFEQVVGLVELIHELDREHQEEMEQAVQEAWCEAQHQI